MGSRWKVRTLSACKVLHVEDVPEDRSRVKQALAGLGVTLLEAVDGQEGLAVARRELPDLVLLDLSLPLLDAWQLLARLKGDGATRRVMVVALTAFAIGSEESRVRSAGGDGYLGKPVDPAGLARLVEGLLERVR